MVTKTSAGIAALALTALAVAGCGSSKSGSNAVSDAASKASSAASSALGKV